MPQDRPVALVSLTDRTGLPELAAALARAGYRIVASAGTAAALRSLGVVCEDVEALTGYPELLGGRVKTLHPAVFGGILARTNGDDTSELQRHTIAPISVVAVNLYRFADVASRPDAPEAQALEQIDVGGVALLRAAAKNYEHVSVLAEPGMYGEFIEALAAQGPTTAQRRRWAARAFALVAEYDDAIASYFAGQQSVGLPDVLSLTLPARSRLRYGENPWAQAVFYHGKEKAFPQALSGKQLSYNNMLDVDSCLRLIAPIVEPLGFPGDVAAAKPVQAAIVKHTVPCGLASAPTSKDALEAALGADPISAFGGIVATNARLDVASAQLLQPCFLEVVAAPEFDDAALELLRAKKHLRLLRFDPELPAQLLAQTTVRSALGGVLAEQPDPQAAPDEWSIVTKRRPSAEAWRDLLFAFGAVRQVKSNAAVVVRDQVMIGVCGGQTNRVAAVELACRRAGDAARGARLATDGFFPFADGVQAAIDAGIGEIVAPRGSIRDAEVIEAAERGGVTLVFTSRRYFLH